MLCLSSMHRKDKLSGGLSLLELLLVVSSIAILATLILAGMNVTKSRSRRIICLNNIRQIGLGLRLYIDDFSDQTPKTPSTKANPFLSYYGYKQLVESYFGISDDPSPQNELFACPSDTFYYGVSNGIKVRITQSLHSQPFTDFLSYGFNAGNVDTNINRFGVDSSLLGISGRTLSSIKSPARTVFLLEAPASGPFSWHHPRRTLDRQNERFNDAMNMLSFVDGHVSYLKIYWSDTTTNGASLSAMHENPPAAYGYQWHGD